MSQLMRLRLVHGCVLDSNSMHCLFAILSILCCASSSSDMPSLRWSTDVQSILESPFHHCHCQATSSPPAECRPNTPCGSTGRCTTPQTGRVCAKIQRAGSCRHALHTRHRRNTRPAFLVRASSLDLLCVV